MKYIYLTFQDQSVWRLPLWVVARDFSTYYENRSDRFDYVMNDDYEGIDWMQNSMKWNEIEPHLELVESAPHEDPRASEFPNMDSEIKESDE
jgi:hypothetical protein